MNKTSKTYKDFRDVTFFLLGSGIEKFSARLVVDKLRWDAALAKRKFSCSNEAAVLMARRFEEDFPEYAGTFTKRLAKCDVDGITVKSEINKYDLFLTTGREAA